MIRLSFDSKLRHFKHFLKHYTKPHLYGGPCDRTLFFMYININFLIALELCYS